MGKSKLCSLILVLILISNVLSVSADESVSYDEILCEPSENEESFCDAIFHEETIADETDTETIINVSVPTNLDFKIDPFEIAGRGQIYSDDYIIQNVGATDVLMTISQVQVIFANEYDFQAVAHEIDYDYQSPVKTVYMVLNINSSPLIITDSAIGEYETILLDGDKLKLSVSGNLNMFPAERWRDGDIKILLSYSLELIESELEIEDDTECDLNYAYEDDDYSADMIANDELSGESYINYCEVNNIETVGGEDEEEKEPDD